MGKDNLVIKHHDYTLGEDVIDAEVSVYSIAKCITSEQFAELLDTYVNNYSVGYGHGHNIGLKLRSSHRTLQRSIIVELVGIIAGISEQDYTDARNEHAIKLAKSIKALYEDIGAGWMV